MSEGANAPHHAHVYFDDASRATAAALREAFAQRIGAGIEFVGRMVDGPIGPHPISQFELHFGARQVAGVRAMIEPTGLRALIHPLSDDDLADHVTNAEWIGEPLELDVSALDPPGVNQGEARFGKSDF